MSLGGLTGALGPGWGEGRDVQHLTLIPQYLIHLGMRVLHSTWHLYPMPNPQRGQQWVQHWGISRCYYPHATGCCWGINLGTHPGYGPLRAQWGTLDHYQVGSGVD